MMMRDTSTDSPQMVLQVQSLRAGYGNKTVLDNVSFDLNAGEIIALLGINGAGKSTCLKTIAGILPAQGGSIRLCGLTVNGRAAAQNARAGLLLVPEGARSFHDLTVRENLEIGGFIIGRGALFRERYDEALSYFPRLRERLTSKAGLLSGGERQMLAIGRALMLRPRVLLLDEPFLGLSPIIIGEVTQLLKRLQKDVGCGIILAEQHVAATLRCCNRAFALREHVMKEIDVRDLEGKGDSEVAASLLGAF